MSNDYEWLVHFHAFPTLATGKTRWTMHLLGVSHRHSVQTLPAAVAAPYCPSGGGARACLFTRVLHFGWYQLAKAAAKFQLCLGGNGIKCLLNSPSSWNSVKSSSLRSSSALEVQRNYTGTWRNLKSETPFKPTTLGKHQQIQKSNDMERQPSVPSETQMAFPCFSIHCSLITKQNSSESQFHHFMNETSFVGKYLALWETRVHILAMGP